MEDSKACLLSHVLDGEGTGLQVDLSRLSPDDGRLLWLHLNAAHAEVRRFLKEQLRLDPLIVKALLSSEARPRLEEVGDNALIILRGINFNPGPKPEDLVSVRVWVAGNRIVSVGRRKARAIADIDERIRQGRGPRRTGEFVALLCSGLNDGIAPALSEMEKATDALEEKSLDNPDAALRGEIAAIRKQATQFRRHMSPQRDVIARLQRSKQGWMTEGDRWYMQDNLDGATRYIEDLDALRERAQILHDELSSALSSRLNKNLYVLSVITVIFMPLSFLSGLLGMNVKGIPGAESPYAFAAVCLIAALVAVSQLFILRRLKWI